MNFLEMNKERIQEILSNYVPVTESGCYIYLGSTRCERDKYGSASINNRNVAVHRLSYEYHKGIIPKGLLVLHTCDVRMCINPNHLYVGTQQNNMDDAFKRNRFNPIKGAQHSCAQLTEKQAIEIKKGKFKSAYYERKFNITRKVVYGIWYNKTWKHLK